MFLAMNPVGSFASAARHFQPSVPLDHDMVVSLMFIRLLTGGEASRYVRDRLGVLADSVDDFFSLSARPTNNFRPGQDRPTAEAAPSMGHTRLLWAHESRLS